MVSVVFLQVEKTEKMTESEKEELLSFLTDQDLPMSCYDCLIDCGFTFQRLKYINDSDLLHIFPKREQCGIRAEFRSKLKKWKEDIVSIRSALFNYIILHYKKYRKCLRIA
nr:uncharacterized protein LOC118877079 [Drosophila suzukii]